MNDQNQVNKHSLQKGREISLQEGKLNAWATLVGTFKKIKVKLRKGSEGKYFPPKYCKAMSEDCNIQRRQHPIAHTRKQK